MMAMFLTKKERKPGHNHLQHFIIKKTYTAVYVFLIIIHLFVMFLTRRFCIFSFRSIFIAWN